MGFTFEGQWYGICRSRTGRLVWAERVPNGVCLPALTDVLQVYFASGTQKPSWYAGVIAESGYEEVSADDTAASHSGWTEETGYSETTRPQLGSLQFDGGVMTMGSALSFTYTVTTTVRGLFVASVSGKGSPLGILWSTAPYSAARSVPAGATLTWSYTLRAAEGS